ncbi:MAG: hypothetical protein F6K65_34115 [Moorea sp. SIO3C2]|nr:hypothetical protein [Moorena sp. SIO3C2]
MRYTIFFHSCLLPLACSLLPAHCSLKKNVPHEYNNCYKSLTNDTQCELVTNDAITEIPAKRWDLILATTVIQAFQVR